MATSAKMGLEWIVVFVFDLALDLTWLREGVFAITGHGEETK